MSDKDPAAPVGRRSVALEEAIAGQRDVGIQPAAQVAGRVAQELAAGDGDGAKGQHGAAAEGRVADVLYVHQGGAVPGARAAAISLQRAIVEENGMGGQQAIASVQPAAVAAGDGGVERKVGAGDCGGQRGPGTAAIAAEGGVAQELRAGEREAAVAIQAAPAMGGVVDHGAALDEGGEIAGKAGIRPAAVVTGHIAEEIDGRQGGGEPHEQAAAAARGRGIADERHAR